MPPYFHTTHHAQVLIIGTGIAGLFTALKLADAGLTVCVVTKTTLAESNSRYAQGGIAAVMPENPTDSVDLHVTDTIRAGAGLCDPAVVRDILAQGYASILDLLRYGVPFDRDGAQGDAKLAFTQEAAHSVKRIIHAGGDATGQSVELALIQQIYRHSSVTVVEHCTIVDLWTQGDKQPCCVGAWGIQPETSQLVGFESPHVILATGGAGQLYPNTTNPPIATGDGIYLARQAGAAVRDLEFVQFHPTAFYQRSSGQVKFLISEALRGEGALLLNHEGERFITHPDKELAPRDVVTRAIFAEQQRTSQPHVWLSLEHRPASLIEHRFPTILKLCLEEGVDIRNQPIPVSPAAHYMMGGVSVNTLGQTSVDGLYAVGEVACTGLHGANRLASNSLLECVVLARQAAETIELAIKTSTVSKHVVVPPQPLFTTVTAVNSPIEAEYPQIQQGIDQLKQLMWQRVGIVRTGQDLTSALMALNLWQTQTEKWQWHWFPENPLLGWQSHQMAVLACWIVQAALARTDSVGAHFRQDAENMTVCKVY